MENLTTLIKTITKSEQFQKYQIYILPTVAVLITLGLIFLVIIPQINNYLSNSKQVTQADQTAAAISDKITFLRELDASVYKQDLDTSFLALPTDQEIPQAYAQLSFLLSSNNLKLNDITVSSVTDGGPSSGGGAQTYAFHLDVSGDVTSFKGFINSLKTAPRVMKVTSLDVTQAANGTLQYGMTIEVFYQPLPTALGSVEAPVSKLTDDQIALLKAIANKAKSIPTVGSNPAGTVGKTDPFN